MTNTTTDWKAKAEAFVEADGDPCVALQTVEEVRDHWVKLGGWAEVGDGSVACVECWYNFNEDPPSLWGTGDEPPTPEEYEQSKRSES